MERTAEAFCYLGDSVGMVRELIESEDAVVRVPLGSESSLGVWYGRTIVSRVPADVITSNDCTNVCHFPFGTTHILNLSDRKIRMSIECITLGHYISLVSFR